MKTDNSQKAKFSIGEVVRHRLFEFRGIIDDVDFKFNNSDSLKNFEENFKNIISDLRQSFSFKENNFVGVCAYSFEKEAIVTVP